MLFNPYYLLSIFLFASKLFCAQTFEIDFGNDVDDRARGSVELSSGNFITYGYTKESSTMWPMYILRLNETGAVVWEETYGEEGILRWGFCSLEKDDDIVIAGADFSEATDSLFIHIMKIDDSGNELWSKTYRNYWRSSVNDIVELPNGDMIGIGSVYPIPVTTFQDLLLVKFTSEGDTLWTKEFPSTERDYGASINLNQNGNLIATGGYDNSLTGDYDIWLKEFDLEGNELWTESYNPGLRDAGTEVEQLSNGDYLILADHHDIPSIRRDILLMRTSESGVEQWTRTYGTENDDDGSSLLIDDSDGVYIAGFSEDLVFEQEDAFLLHLNSDGDSIWSQRYGYEGRDWFEDIIKTSDGRFLMTGKTEGEAKLDDNYYLVLTDMDGNVSVTEQLNTFPSIFPNPCSEKLFLPYQAEYRIHDLAGRLVHAGRGQELDVSALESGMFILVVDEDSIVRFVKE